MTNVLLQTLVMSLANLAIDVSQFVTTFAAPISQSAPHIYISALPFSPVEENVSDFLPPGTLDIQTGRRAHWEADIYVLNGHTDFVRSVAFSPDGSKIISCSDDKRFCIWDANTSKSIG